MPTMRRKAKLVKMAEIITLELPERLAQQAKEIAVTHRRRSDLLVEWIDRAIMELPIESLPYEQVLVLCNLQIEREQQEVFSDLLARNQEGQLNDAEVKRLDDLIEVYRRGLVRKARAMKVAVERGFKPPYS